MDPRVGYRFHPSDTEICSYYLVNKCLGAESKVSCIRHIPVCKFEPWHLRREVVLRQNCVAYFFFDRPSKSRIRTTRVGFWKVTGRGREIRAPVGDHEIIGVKKTLVFYRGRHPNVNKTSWVMKEYLSFKVPPNQRNFVLYKVKNISDGNLSLSTCSGGESYLPPSDFQDSATRWMVLRDNEVEESSKSLCHGDSPLDKVNGCECKLGSSNSPCRQQKIHQTDSNISPKEHLGLNEHDKMDEATVMDTVPMESNEITYRECAHTCHQRSEVECFGLTPGAPLDLSGVHKEETEAADPGYRLHEANSLIPLVKDVGNELPCSPKSCRGSFHCMPASEISNELHPPSLCWYGMLKGSSLNHVDAVR